MRKLKIKIEEYGLVPRRAHRTDAGLDLRTPVSVTIEPRCAWTIDTGVCIQLPKGTVGLVKSKSGLMCRNNITTDGVVDVGYQGPIKVRLQNNGDEPYSFMRGDKVAQLVVVPCGPPKFTFVTEFKTKTKRGKNGFGSTGK